MSDFWLQILTAIIGGAAGTAFGYMGALLILGKRLEKAVTDFHNYVESKKKLDADQDKDIKENKLAIIELDKKFETHVSANTEKIAVLEKEILQVLQKQSIVITELKKDIEYMRKNYK